MCLNIRSSDRAMALRFFVIQPAQSDETQRNSRIVEIKNGRLLWTASLYKLLFINQKNSVEDSLHAVSSLLRVYSHVTWESLLTRNKVFMQYGRFLVLDHLPYYSDLAPRNFFLFPKLTVSKRRIFEDMSIRSNATRVLRETTIEDNEKCFGSLQEGWTKCPHAQLCWRKQLSMTHGLHHNLRKKSVPELFEHTLYNSIPSFTGPD